MPVTLNSNLSRYDRPAAASSLKRPGRGLAIGLINNMSDGALEATERQFISLLDAASDGFSIDLSLYSLPGVPRNEAGARHIHNFYSSVETLWDTPLDGLIVTGREPLTPNLADESYWEDFTKVVDWAQDKTCSTIWSCLAAHAAILYRDGIGRVRREQKYSGIFDCVQVSDHALTAGTSARFHLPHSRWNGIAEDQLTARGYQVLSRAADGDVDTFIQQDKSMFVFFQGHPEYESNTLMLEYRRDVARYFRGETKVYPAMPRDYFDRDTVSALSDLQNEAILHPGEELLAELNGILEEAAIENTWHSTAAYIYRNWLEYICAQKELRLQNGATGAKAHRVQGSLLALASAHGVPA